MGAVLLAAAMFASLAEAQSELPSDPFNRSFNPPVVICFPPVAPPLDWPVAHLTPPVPARLAPPPELAAFVNEPFYAPLSTRLAVKDLDEKLRHRLDAYRVGRSAILDDLEAELAKMRDADAPARQRAFEELARRQAGPIADVEKNAESLREDLLERDYSWNAQREWRLGDAADRGDSPLEIAQVMRAYAFYHRGLLPAQRRLLREISLELSLAGEDAAAAAAAQPFVLFSPELTRVVLPENLPAALAARVADYQTKKSALKKELYDAVFADDSATLAFLLPGGLKSLPETQAGRLAELETLAEEIRRGLAELPAAPPAVEQSPLPPVLTTRIALVRRSRLALQKDTMSAVEEIQRRARAAHMPVQVSYTLDSDGLKFSVMQRRGSHSADASHDVEAIRREMTAVSEDFGRRFAELLNETEAIRRGIAESTGKTARPAIEATLADAVRFVALEESKEAYRDYRTAVFEPGLSPGQRRLLWGRALEKLDLPLPRGDLQPTRRAASW